MDDEYALSLEDVIAHGRYASCAAGAGCFEFDQGRFWVTSGIGSRERRPVVELRDLPAGPWEHAPTCTCHTCWKASVDGGAC